MTGAPTTQEPVSDHLLRFTIVGAVVIVATSAAATIQRPWFGAVHAAVSCAAFAVGTGAMAWAYVQGLRRSREEVVSLGGLFFLSGDTAPTPVRHRFLACLAAEVVAVVVAAGVHPFTEVAFGILAPMHALGLMSLWGAWHGRFPVRTEE